MQLRRNDQQDEYFTVIQLHKEADFLTKEVGLFDSGDEDLNEFLHSDAWNYKQHLLAETYLCYPTESFNNGNRNPIAYISLCNDCIQITKETRKNELRMFWKACIQKKFPNDKRFLTSYPAVKIARLAVERDYRRGGIGTHLLNMIKSLFLRYNRTGCRFLTVDAYNIPETTSFYEKNNFSFLWDEDKDDDQRIMWFDLEHY